MIGHYLRAAAGNLTRNLGYALISLLGLAVAFATLFLITAYVKDELTHDAWIPGHADVYRLAKTARFGQQVLKGDASDAVEALWLKQDIPEVRNVVRLWPEERGVRSGSIEFSNTVVWADPELFKVLPLRTFDGSADRALEDPDGIVISRALARNLFGTERVIGRSLEIDRKFTARVTAVLEDFPGASHLSIDLIASSRSSHSPFAAQSRGRINFGPVYAYVRLAPGTLEAVRSALPALVDRHVSAADLPGVDPGARMSEMWTYDLQPISGIHMIPAQDRLVPLPTDLFTPAGDRLVVMALAAVAILVVLVAAANFINIMTAMAVRRATEVGVRKVSGARRSDLVVQFMGESTLLATVAALVGVAAGLYYLPTFGAFLNRELSFDHVLNPVMAVSMLGMTLLVGALGGFYPALVLSALRPALVLNGDGTPLARTGTMRSALVVFQFVLLIVLVVVVTVISRQIAFVTNSKFGLDTDQLLFVNAPCNDALRDRMNVVPGVRGAACADRSVLGMDGAAPVPATLPDGTPFRFNVVGIGPGALELYGLRPLAGRFDGQGVIINQAALRGMRFSTPEHAIGQPLTPGSVGDPPPIIGVVADFPLRSLRDPIGPVVFKVRPAVSRSLLMIKLSGENLGESLQAIDRVWKESASGPPPKSQFYNQLVQRQYEDIIRMKEMGVVFSVIATIIAGLGLYGLSALAIEQRALEIGIRKSLGASKGDISRLLLWQFMLPALLANLFAWPVAYLVMRRWLEGFAYRADLNWSVFLAASAIALVVALAAVAGHAFQLARLRPIVALRHR